MRGTTRGLWRGLLLASSLLPGVALAADGDLDPKFGVGGKVHTSFNVPIASASAVALQPDGKLVTAGWLFDESANVDFAVARYNPDGSLDSAFGSGGRVRTDFFGRVDVAYALAVRSDGKIIVAGAATTPTNEMVPAIVRYLPDGHLDESFDVDGKLTGSFLGLARAVVLLPDGSIVIGGGGFRQGTSQDFMLARYNSNGSVDSTFGTAGIVHTDFSGMTDDAYALLRVSGGKLLAIGTSESNVTVFDLALARYDSEGKPDSTFGQSGKITFDFSGTVDVGLAAAPQPDDKVVIAASILSVSGPNDLSVVRLLPEGTLDPSFGISGRAVAAFPGDDAIAYAVAVQSDGKVVAAGLALGPDRHDFALARFDATGLPDQTFGLDGRLVTDFFGRADVSYGVLLQSDGKIVAAGSAADDTTGYMALARYVSSVTLPSSCPRSAGFWKSHRSEWPVSTLTLGSQSYSASEIASLLAKPVQGDASVILARDLVAAKFNVAAGVLSTALAADIASADALLAAQPGRLPYGVSAGSPEGRAMIDLAGRLASQSNRRSFRDCPAGP